MFSILGNPPFITFAVFAVCCFNLFFHASVGSICYNPELALPHLQLYRIFTAPFYHGGFFHLLFNMLAWMTMAKDLENTIGSLALLYTVLALFIPSAALMHAFAAVLVDNVFGSHYWRECGIGLSGVLFAILVVQLQLSGDDRASFFGLFDLPVHVYPWLLAALLQLISPRLSLLGHLSGIVAGYALARGYFRRITPSDRKLEQWERSLRLVQLPAWQPVPSLFAGALSYLGAVLPVARDAPPPLTHRVRAAWARLTSAFSSSSDENASVASRGGVSGYANYSAVRASGGSGTTQWCGVGHTLGSSADPPPAAVVNAPSQPPPVAQVPPTRGRIPENSRLLREAGASPTRRRDETDAADD